jgi:Carboxylesterase type B
MGDSGNMTYGPYYLMDRDVVYVNLNYRLGVLGMFYWK